jgi:hypothetical protein
MLDIFTKTPLKSFFNLIDVFENNSCFIFLFKLYTVHFVFCIYN